MEQNSTTPTQTDKPQLDGAKLVASAIIGADFERVIVNDTAYMIHPPTISKLAGATYWLAEMGEAKSIHELLKMMQNVESAAHALSWFIQGDDSLAEELAQGTLTEVVTGIETAFSLIEMENFLKLSVLMKSAKKLIAKQR